MHIETQFSVFLVNKPGVLANVIGALAKARINIIALTLTDYSEQGVLRVVCENSAQARAVLGRAHNRWTETDVLVLELPNEPGDVRRRGPEAGRRAREHPLRLLHRRRPRRTNLRRVQARQSQEGHEGALGRARKRRRGGLT